MTTITQVIKQRMDEFEEKYVHTLAPTGIRAVQENYDDEIKPHNQETVEAILEAVHTHLVSEEARIEKEGINSDFENGYFEAIDDVAKYLSSTLKDIKNNNEKL